MITGASRAGAAALALAMSCWTASAGLASPGMSAAALPWGNGFPPTQADGGSAGPTVAGDFLRAANVVPPGESGLDTLTGFAGRTSGATTTYGPHTADQLGLYAAWKYKSMQFTGPKTGAAVPGDAFVTIWRDPTYGVPTITATTDADAFYGVGYAMAADRLFQMEVFRHVGHGTLAALIGAAGLPMDEAVRRVTEGPAARAAELAALPADAQLRLARFTDGVNAYISSLQSDPSQLPAEFTLLGDLPIQPWTMDDTLSFGEYAGRFFGQFSGAEMGAALTYLDLVSRDGQPTAEKIFEDLLPLDDPNATTSIAPADGVFPRHVGTAVPTSFRGSPYANHDPAVLPPLAQLAPVARQVDAQARTVRLLQRVLGLPRFGSNSVIVSGRLTRDGHPLLYGGPQTGWAVPGFFWEAEIHDPIRDQRGVMVPAIPLCVSGRNASAAWTVTSALDANADVYVEQLDATNTSYVHDGQRLAITQQTETIPCNTPPSSATSLLTGSIPALCPVPPVSITVYRSVHGPAIAPPDAGHHLYVLDSVVDHHLLQSLTAWDLAGRQSDASHFGAALSAMSLGFNFLYVDDHGSIGYWHAGAYPIRAANADPTLPMPGTGAYDWQGLEPWAAHPHVINPSSGYLVNWNNKPAVGWYSKPIVGELNQPDRWGDQWESVALAADVPTREPLTFPVVGQVPHDVGYVDNPARLLRSRLISALQGSTAPQLVAIREYLASWDGLRNHVTSAGKYSTPAIVFFDRFFEHLESGIEASVLGSDFAHESGLVCATPPCHYVSVDNLDAPTY
ncbi:MAG TPA: penicillin acylase family protein, partial [Mycobacteriales bacterium]|nr:penicillin acylase family protein [Mycobacteriales bacterium]